MILPPKLPEDLGGAASLFVMSVQAATGEPKFNAELQVLGEVSERRKPIPLIGQSKHSCVSSVVTHLKGVGFVG